MSAGIELENKYCAPNYHPLPVVLTRGEGVFVWDEDGKKYLDMMSAYSAVSHGHTNPRLVRVLKDQADRLSVVSRAFHSGNLGKFLQRACELTGQAVFDSLAGQIKKSLAGRGGPGIFTVPGLMKLKVVKKPARKARMGINPFTKVEMMFKAKPASKSVKVLALKGLKDMV